jgi:HAD superfamily hydrolase (TIGR01549 family)
MEIRSNSDFFGFSLFIFDLDNTIYNEEDYLFDAYKQIATSMVRKIPSKNEDELNLTLRKIYEAEGRINLFDKFLNVFDLDPDYLQDCLKIMRSFNAGKKYMIYPSVKTVLAELISRKKPIYVLTNGNPEQQRNKINNINWEELDRSIFFVFANEFEPKPSPSGVEYILNISGIEKNKTVMVGDSETDHDCARNSGITFLNVIDLSNLFNS